MSAVSPVATLRNADVIGKWLHSLSQPLTGLRCVLELSLADPPGLSPEEVERRRLEVVAAALQQTEKAIAVVELMRDYMEAEQRGMAAISPSS
jgi:hypothetical protein